MLPGYTIEGLLDHSIAWLAEIYPRATRHRMSELKIQACLQRISNEDLDAFNKDAEQKMERMARAVDFMNLPGFGRVHKLAKG